MVIKKLTTPYIEEYNKLALKYGAVFNTYQWLEMFEKNLCLFGFFDRGNNLIGGFHLFRKRKFGLTIYRNPPFTPFIGPFLKMDAQNPVSATNKYREALSLMAEFLDKLDYSTMLFSFGRNIVDTLPFIWKKFKVVPGYTYILDLAEPLSAIEGGMSAERRNDIKKALRDELTVKRISDFNCVKSLVLKTFSRQGKNVNEHYLDKILFKFANETNSFAFATFMDEKCISCTFCVHDNRTAYYLLGGYDHESKHHGAGALAMWEAIKFAKELGLKFFDFEGSMVPQIERHFRGYGGKLTPYFRVNKARLPLEILLKFYKRELF